MSDLHNEFECGEGPREPTTAWESLAKTRRSILGHPQVGPFLGHLRQQKIDLIVMAGDIDLGHHGITYADRVSLFLGVPIVYVMGNHEAYGGRDLDLLVSDLRAAADATCGRVTFLENDAATFEIRGQRVHVLGCCLFTDYALNFAGDDGMDENLKAHLAMYGDHRFRPDRDGAIGRGMRDAANGLNDHLRIFLNGKLFSPEMARQIHEVSRKWLGDEVARIRAHEGEDATILVVTHHAPIPDAIPPHYRGKKLSPAFASDLRAEIAEWRPAAWIWGHTHHSMETEFGRTRLITSQRGYIGREPKAEEYLPEIIAL